MKELSYEELKNVYDPESLGFDTTESVEPFDGIIGQERAVKAFEFGLSVKTKGYNIYVAGPSGSGKTTYARQSAQKKAKGERVPYDWCYVYNFDDPRMPLSLRFEPGGGRQFRDDMNELIAFFKTELSKAFSSEDYDRQKTDLSRVYDEKGDELIKRLDDIATNNGFSLKTSSAGIIFQPLVDGKLIDEEEYDKLDEAVKEGINERLESMQDDVNSIMRDIKGVDKEYRQKMDDLDYKIGMFAIGHYVSSLQEKYKNSERVIKYLEAVQEDVLENIDQFAENEPDEEDPIMALIPKIGGNKTEDATLKYRVNLIVDNSRAEGAPVIVDYNPTYYNLVGEVEYDNEYGNLTTDFMKIKPGLMHKANGGYLILQVQDLLNNVQSWEALRRIIKTREIAIENLRDQLGGIAVTTLKPEPIPADVKVILIGGAYYYDLLRSYDDDFSKLFKIRADFDYEMDRSGGNIDKIAGFISAFSKNEGTAPFDSSAVAAVIGYSSRIVESRKKMSTRLNLISEILAEAAAWAEMDGAKIVTAEYIKKAEKESIDIYDDFLWQAGIAAAKKTYWMCKKANSEVGFIGGGARGLHHFTEMVGAEASITINWVGTADKLIEKNPPVVERFRMETPEAVIDELCDKLPDFRKAYFVNEIKPEEYEEFGPVVLFRSSFEEAWRNAEQYVNDYLNR